jgi:Adenylyl/Guanylyl and SMODS C-terminal sensor domain
MIRGQIIGSSLSNIRQERTSFRGEHVVERFVVKDDIVVARDRTYGPISNTSAAWRHPLWATSESFVSGPIPNSA